jgi:hypothetical protein
MSDKVFVDGMIVRRSERAPEFVHCNLAINMKEFITWAKEHHEDGWVNISCMVSNNGKHYAALDTFKPSEKKQHDAGMAQANDALANTERKATEEPFDDDVPF